MLNYSIVNIKIKQLMSDNDYICIVKKFIKLKKIYLKGYNDNTYVITAYQGIRSCSYPIKCSKYSPRIYLRHSN